MEDTREGMCGHRNDAWKQHGIYGRYLETWEGMRGHREGALKGHGGGWAGDEGGMGTG